MDNILLCTTQESDLRYLKIEVTNILKKRYTDISQFEIHFVLLESFKVSGNTIDQDYVDILHEIALQYTSSFRVIKSNNIVDSILDYIKMKNIRRVIIEREATTSAFRNVGEVLKKREIINTDVILIEKEQ